VFLLRLRLALHEDGGVGETMGVGAGVSGLMPEGGLQTLDVGFPEVQLPEQQSEPSWHASPVPARSHLTGGSLGFFEGAGVGRAEMLGASVGAAVDGAGGASVGAAVDGAGCPVTASYVTEMSSGAVQVPPKYKPSTLPCS